jgi:hypothetical protein
MLLLEKQREAQLAATDGLAADVSPDKKADFSKTIGFDQLKEQLEQIDIR